MQIQILRSRCGCGQRYDTHVFDDGHVERTMPIHCDCCHKQTYERIIFICDECYEVANVQGLINAERIRLDGVDDNEPVLARSTLPVDKTKTLKSNKEKV